jgi:uncharacterized protein
VPIAIPIHVQPRAATSEVVGWHGDAVKIRLKAPPVDGAANAELLRFLAARLGVPRAAVTIVAGATSRRKRVAVEGVPLDVALRKLGVAPPDR